MGDTMTNKMIVNAEIIVTDYDSIYNKNEATMVRGFAILSMLLLHLFCRKGELVFGTPLLWLDNETPFVFWLGYISNICVSLYSICAGYAQMQLYEKNEQRIGKRLLFLILRCWIIIGIFTVISLLLGRWNVVPGNLKNLLYTFAMVRSFNGAWWYVRTYIYTAYIYSDLSDNKKKKFKSRDGSSFNLADAVLRCGALWVSHNQ